MRNHNKLFQKVLTLGVCATITFSGFFAAGATSVNAASSTINAQATATSKAQKVINLGKKFMGVPYKFGAATNTTRNFDCSTFTKYVFKSVGVKLPRTSAQQSKVGKFVSRSNLKAGDLVFFSSGSRANGKNVTHVAIYIGGGKLLHTYGKPGVTISNLNKGNWDRTYLKARRVI
ncbi:NlpC/P60 family protein [Paenibacillus zeisoli]|uniref:NlpC/P60 family protein n=1 Tax=Paenibacillus zeisoli TaxID=2496267 RepID=A0A433XPA5_9BACL|nr:C40 family peptidase [Paenibacillus zeisoli]RUT35932.1 NlpC/P60 family protein [Paenibacillus zeisoli]